MAKAINIPFSKQDRENVKVMAALKDKPASHVIRRIVENELRSRNSDLDNPAG